MTKANTKRLLREIEEKYNFEVITDRKEIYWDDDIAEFAIWNKKGIDIRDKSIRKPIVLKRGRRIILVEWDYGEGGWIAHNKDGGIISDGERKFKTILNIKSMLRSENLRNVR